MKSIWAGVSEHSSEKDFYHSIRDCSGKDFKVAIFLLIVFGLYFWCNSDRNEFKVCSINVWNCDKSIRYALMVLGFNFCTVSHVLRYSDIKFGNWSMIGILPFFNYDCLCGRCRIYFEKYFSKFMRPSFIPL